ncbi:hypothetical protein BWI96_00135 [Siphonobacter sp. SORGH_AS_0500]|uniref:hypothetical protein n=1 Tax=Siphonobacter sp. SORGH_AS_0500 TaxID=1864824 RepID=UPI000CB903C5|nr:hypothetical protein [Siphonobacter sp. SORGH_AS_0500]PKK38243.1 hypothetical protein BWI96_00135 [Siphonobacter sp. SORGH_AS_0500]
MKRLAALSLLSLLGLSCSKGNDKTSLNERVNGIYQAIRQTTNRDTITLPYQGQTITTRVGGLTSTSAKFYIESFENGHTSGVVIVEASLISSSANRIQFSTIGDRNFGFLQNDTLVTRYMINDIYYEITSVRQ